MYFRLMHKTGIYIVEKIEDRPQGALVKVVSVITHPMQGDLHHRGEVDNVFFHERKALSYNEKRIVDNNLLKPYNDDVIEYTDSLKQAVAKLEHKLNLEHTKFNTKSLEMLGALKNDYERQYKIKFER